MPQRIQRRRTKGYRMPAGAVSVTRPGIFGNPFKTVAEFRAWLSGSRHNIGDGYGLRRLTLLARIPEIRGKDLACWCKPGAECHADVLLELANQD